MAVVLWTAFDGFGSRTASAATTDARACYGAQWGYVYDPDIGLTFCASRYYDSGNGRWLTRDPIGYSGGINLYGYCQNNGVTGVDPSGLLLKYPGLTRIGLGSARAAPVVGQIIGLGVEAGVELIGYTPGHPTGPLTTIGDAIGTAVGEVLYPEDDSAPDVPTKPKGPEDCVVWHHYSKEPSLPNLRRGTSVTDWDTDGRSEAEINMGLGRLTRDASQLQQKWHYRVCIPKGAPFFPRPHMYMPGYNEGQLDRDYPVGPPTRIPGR